MEFEKNKNKTPHDDNAAFWGFVMGIANVLAGLVPAGHFRRIDYNPSHQAENTP